MTSGVSRENCGRNDLTVPDIDLANQRNLTSLDARSPTQKPGGRTLPFDRLPVMNSQLNRNGSYLQDQGESK